uniref:Secreted peptide n=1 Tax=Anopheles braziliensis TaxID=58242 RepID=A0A2M3ZLV0_9DIPT
MGVEDAIGPEVLLLLLPLLFAELTGDATTYEMAPFEDMAAEDDTTSAVDDDVTELAATSVIFTALLPSITTCCGCCCCGLWCTAPFVTVPAA